MKEYIKTVLHKILRGYDLYWIYTLQTPMPDPLPEGVTLKECTDRLHHEILSSSGVADVEHYSGSEARVFFLENAQGVAAACAFWWGGRYKRERFIWDLFENEAKLVQITTDPNQRGRGLAPALIISSSRAMLEGRFEALYARVWHSNSASNSAFRKARWSRVAFVFRAVLPYGKPVRVTIPTSHLALIRLIKSALGSSRGTAYA